MMAFRRKQVAVGIEPIAVHVPAHYLPLEALAARYGVDPAKFLGGLGCRRMAVPHPTQDTVTMAATSVSDLMSRYGISREDIGLLVVGTETGVDSSKPVASYVHGMTGLMPSCRVFDLQHACYGATAGLQIAAAWSASEASGGSKALVVASDVSRYQPGSPGEPTQGAGSVAMLVGRRPSVLALDRGTETVHAQAVNDFWRPTYSSTAVVEGHYSMACYLSGLRSCWLRMRSAGSRGRRDFDHLLFHLPFPRMAWKAHLFLAEIERGHAPVDGTREMEEEKESFRQKVEPSLWAARDVGNIYTGSLWLALAALLESDPGRVAGRRIALYSYGSGSCSEVMTGTTGDDPLAWKGLTGLHESLTSRTAIDHPLYTAFREESARLVGNGSFRPGSIPMAEHLPSRTRFLLHGVKDHMRIYRPGDWKPGDPDVPRLWVRDDDPPDGWLDMWMLGPEPPWKVE